MTTPENNKDIHSVEHYYHLFRRSHCDDTLTVMYNGSVSKAKNSLSGRALTLALIDIERALDRRQQDFDGVLREKNFKLHKDAPPSSSSSQPYDPEREMAKLLSSL